MPSKAQTHAMKLIDQGSNSSAIVIGSSAGALETLSALLSELPVNFRFPIFVVIHLPANQDNALVACLQAKTQMNVVEAEDKSSICGGTVYVAPADYHLLVENNGRLSLSSEEPVRYSKPSIDVFFESAADVYGANLIAIILTGGNSDGARGLKKIVDAGGIALVQNPELAKVRMMPEAALQACPGAQVMSVPEMSAYLQKIGGKR